MQTAFIALMKRKMITSVTLFWGQTNVLRMLFSLLKCAPPSFQSVLDVFFISWEASFKGKINTLLCNGFFPRKMEKFEYYPTWEINIFRNQ